MNIQFARIRYTALYIGAFTWPLGYFENLPALDIPVSACCALVLLIATIIDLTKGYRLHVPFELVWPPVTMLAIALLPQWHTGAISRIYIALCCISLITVHHCAGARQLLIRCFWLSLWSGTLSTLLAIAAYAGWIVPTAFTTQARLKLAPFNSVSTTIFVLAILLFIAIMLWAISRTRRARIVIAVLALAPFSLLAWLAKTHLNLLMAWQNDSLLNESFSSLLLIALLVWYTARIVAKFLVQRLEAYTRLPLIYPAVLMASMLLLLLCTPQVLLGFSWLLALLANQAQPGRKLEAKAPFPKILPLACILLCILNALHVFPLARRDPRNYPAITAALRAAGRYDKLVDYLQAVNRALPREAGAKLCFAKTLIQQGQPERAVDVFIDALHLTEAGIFPVPDKTDIDQFLDQLRDHCSALPPAQRGLAYERALLAANRPQSTLAILRVRTTPVTSPEIDKKLLISAFEHLLPHPEIRKEVSSWPTGSLLGLMQGLGATLHPVAAADKSLIVIGKQYPEQFALFLITPTSNYGYCRRGTEEHKPPVFGLDTDSNQKVLSFLSQIRQPRASTAPRYTIHIWLPLDT